MILRPALHLSAGLAIAAALSGCALLSTPDPVQNYRFGLPMAAPSTVGDTPAPLTVSIRRIEFPQAAGDDRILGVTGLETAYIAGARWVSPASTLFDDSLKAAFANRADRIRVLGRREPGTPPLVLQVTVTTFEARYAAPGATPEVVVTARAQLRSTPERQAGGGAIRPDPALANSLGLAPADFATLMEALGFRGRQQNGFAFSAERRRPRRKPAQPADPTSPFAALGEMLGRKPGTGG